MNSGQLVFTRKNDGFWVGWNETNPRYLERGEPFIVVSKAPHYVSSLGGTLHTFDNIYIVLTSKGLRELEVQW